MNKLAKSTLALSLGLAMAANAAVTKDSVATESSTHPNVVLMLADDMGWDIAALGHPTMVTPNLDKLALEGQYWTSFYTTSPICSPSRGALLTGMHPTASGLYGRLSPAVSEEDTATSIPNNISTLGDLMHHAGYATGIVGKWHLGTTEKAYPTRHGFDYWYGTPMSNDGYKTFTMGLKETSVQYAKGNMAAIKERQEKVRQSYLNPSNELWNHPIIQSYHENGKYVDKKLTNAVDQHMVTRNLTNEAKNFIVKNKDKPFFLYFAYEKPHLPHFVDAQFEGKSPVGSLGDTMLELDWSVGQIVDQLDKLGLRDNTLIIFTSDNGPWMVYGDLVGTGGYFRNGKHSTYEGGVRLPAIFNWPGKVKQGRVTDIGSTMDIYSTLAKLTNQKVPKQKRNDSLDLSGTILNGEPSPRVEMPYFFEGEYMAYRYGDYKIHFRISDPLESPDGEMKIQDLKNHYRLYNVTMDPGERFDIAESHPEKVKELLKRFEEYKAKRKIQRPIFDIDILAFLKEEKSKASAQKG